MNYNIIMRYLLYITIPFLFGCFIDSKARKVLSDLSQKVSTDHPQDAIYGSIAKEAAKISNESFYDGFNFMSILTDPTILSIIAIVLSGGTAGPAALSLLKKKKP